MNVATFQPDQIKIFLDTQIPNMKEISITQSILVIDSINSYPYFTGWYKYEKDILLQKTYNDLIKFFFHEETFIDSFKGKEKALESTKYADENINIMIQTLFPTMYPIKNDNTTSHDILMKVSNTNSTFSLKGTIPFLPSFNNNFSYLYINKSIYTVTSTCILNDIINHPQYSKLLQDFVLFQSWRYSTKNNITQKIHRLKLNINSILEKDYKVIQEVRDEINGTYIRRYTHEDEKNKYIVDLHELFLLQLRIIDDDKYFTSLQKLQNKIKENTFSITLRFVTISNYIKDFIDLSLVNNYYFIFKNDINTVNVDTERFMELNYKEYIDFYYKVSNFNTQHRSIINKKLQTIIDNYVDKKNFHLESLLLYINDKYIKNRKNTIFPIDLTIYNVSSIDELLYIGITKYNYINQDKLAYEVYVNFNLISGKLDNKNISYISCDYKNEILGNAYLDINKSISTVVKKPIIELKTILRIPKKNKNSIHGGNKHQLNSLYKKRKNKSRISRKRIIKKKRFTKKKVSTQNYL